MMSRWVRRAVGTALAGLVMVAMTPSAHAATPTGFSYQDRLGGTDRYGTSVSITRQWFAQPSAPTVYIASGENYPDALAAGAAAAVKTAPVMLARRGEIPAPVLDEIRRLQPGRIILLGGEAALGSQVEAQARTVSGFVERIAGATRYETAQLISRSVFEGNVPVVYLASGRSFPDALAGAAAAGHQGGPVLLTDPGTLSEAAREELSRLHPAKIVVLGGTAAVSNAVQTAAGAYGQTTRIEGTDRYATAAALSAAVFDAPRLAFIASGQNFPDALSGAARAGAEGSPVLLVQPTAVPASVCTELKRLSPTVVTALGGDGAVSNATLRGAALRCPAPAPAPNAQCTNVAGPGLDGALARPAVEDALAAIRSADVAIPTGFGLATPVKNLDEALARLEQAGTADVCQQAYYTQLLWEIRVDTAQAVYDASIFDRSVANYRSARAGFATLLQMINEDLGTSYRMP